MTAPAGFVSIGRMSASSGSGQDDDTKEDHFLRPPIGARVDTSYRMVGGLTTSGGGASSPLAAGDVPPGFYIECGGSDTHGKRWAVLKPYNGDPILTAAALDPLTLTVAQLQFNLGLYADTGSAIGQGGATTVVDVWYKPAP